MSPFLITSDFLAVCRGMIDKAVEGIVWKNAIPDNIMDIVTKADFKRIQQGVRGAARGRDLWQKETIVQGFLSQFAPELAVVDDHILDIRRQFAEHALSAPPKTRAALAPCHFISSDPLVLSNHVPHVDAPKEDAKFQGVLGKAWLKQATPDIYPFYKIVASLNWDSEKSTILIPSEDKGVEDSEFACHYPHAKMDRAIQASPGDIVVLKQCVTVHCGPANIERRWFTVY